ncbi:type III secretion system cytoplasmic ring protein SctQ [Thiothrix eikelboomii]|uniref:type III secretion system cytoplasmic ring protein SctQ n=1 Tax=Thiothrix eikelboomii TaxID=92487 RepID=UPI003BB0D015
MTDERRRITLKLLAPPSWTPAAVRMNNLLLTKTQPFAFFLSENKAFRLQIFPAEPNSNLVFPIGLTLGIGDTTAGLWLSEWPLLDQIRSYIPEGMLARLPENLGIALAENALDPLITRIENGLGSKIKIQSLSADKNSNLYALPLSFELLEGQRNAHQQEQMTLIRGLLMVEERLYPLIQERLRFWPSDTELQWENLEANLFLEIGTATVSVQEVNHFEPSDIILLDNNSFRRDGLIRLRLNTLLYCGAQLIAEPNRQITITTDWNIMSDNDQKQSVQQINQLPVQLSFDLGQKTLSFNEVKQLRPGYVIDLSQSLPEVVQIRAQNKLIGTGELVDISGRIGVRILSLFGNRSKTG